MKKTIIMIIMALVSISAFGKRATREEVRTTVESLYEAMQGTMDIDSIYDIVCPLEYSFLLRTEFSDYSPIVLKEALNRLVNSKQPVMFFNICDEVNYEMDYPEFTHLVPFYKQIIGTTELSAGQVYKRLNENYSGVDSYNIRSEYKFRYITSVNEIPFTYVHIEFNEYGIIYQGLEKDWPKYEEKINELIKVITTF